MFIPYSVDAPLYYAPIGTVALIAANVVIYLGHLAGRLSYDGWVLRYGDGLHPGEWLLSNFAHASMMHLVGNMLFLWVFGLVVEGKLGVLRFLSCYLAIGTLHGLIQQLTHLGYVGPVPGALGASAAIYGVLAMACVWAPANEVSVWVWLGFYIHFTTEITVGVMAALYIGWEVIAAGLLGTLSSSWAHLLGTLLGAPIAVGLLKTGVVDCEDWDVFAVVSGNYGPYAAEKRRETPIPVEKIASHAQQRQAEGLRRFDAYLEIHKPLEAIAVRRRMADLGAPLSIDAPRLMKLIVALHRGGHWAESAPIMAEYAAGDVPNADAVRVKLAQICVKALQRPSTAVETLRQVDQAKLTPDQRQLFQRVNAVAARQIDEGALELDEAPW